MAMDLFNKIEKRPFVLIHCWEILKNQAKWLDISDGSKRQDYGRDDAETDEFVQPLPDDLSHSVDQSRATQGSGHKRSIGHDAAEAKAKKSSAECTSNAEQFVNEMSDLAMLKLHAYEKENTETIGQIDKLVLIQKKQMEMDEKKMENELVNSQTALQQAVIAKRHADIEHRKAEIESRKAELDQRNSDIAFMSMDMTKCSPAQRKVIEAMQKAIVARWGGEES